MQNVQQVGSSLLYNTYTALLYNRVCDTPTHGVKLMSRRQYEQIRNDHMNPYFYIPLSLLGDIENIFKGVPIHVNHVPEHGIFGNIISAQVTDNPQYTKPGYKSIIVFFKLYKSREPIILKLLQSSKITNCACSINYTSKYNIINKVWRYTSNGDKYRDDDESSGYLSHYIITEMSLVDDPWHTGCQVLHQYSKPKDTQFRYSNDHKNFEITGQHFCNFIIHKKMDSKDTTKVSPNRANPTSVSIKPSATPNIVVASMPKVVSPPVASIIDTSSNKNTQLDDVERRQFFRDRFGFEITNNDRAAEYCKTLANGIFMQERAYRKKQAKELPTNTMKFERALKKVHGDDSFTLNEVAKDSFKQVALDPKDEVYHKYCMSLAAYIAKKDVKTIKSSLPKDQSPPPNMKQTYTPKSINSNESIKLGDQMNVHKYKRPSAQSIQRPADAYMRKALEELIKRGSSIL